MTERPILFSAPMVRALLAGTKTQTRRVVKPQPFDRAWSRHDHKIGYTTDDEGIDLYAYSKSSGGEWHARCPYGQPGDRLWVREAFDPIYGQSPPDRIIEVDYRADWEPHGKHYRMKDEMGIRRWKPSIHMPRELSRILLEIVSVRVERLQDISERDAEAEGCTADPADGPTFYDDYRGLWESINGPGSWAANPWVWVVEFKRVTP